MNTFGAGSFSEHGCQEQVVTARNWPRVNAEKAAPGSEACRDIILLLEPPNPRADKKGRCKLLKSSLTLGIDLEVARPPRPRTAPPQSLCLSPPGLLYIPEISFSPKPSVPVNGILLRETFPFPFF